ncbi:MAG: ABC transporter substrate-binding protein [Clostridium sp.]
MPWPWQRAFCPAAAAAAEKKRLAAATEAADAKETTAAEKETEKETEKADEGEKKQALSVSLDAEPDSLDLAKVSDMYSTTVVSQMIEGLTAIRVDENGAETVEPGMAESWESSEDQMTWTFHLRDAKWEDGVDVKAGDFEYAIKRILESGDRIP